MHTGGDKDIDYYMDAIEQASQRAGLTLEEIRAKRHAFDHGSGGPRPDQIPRMKNLGMMASQNNTYLWGDTAAQKAERYGDRICQLGGPAQEYGGGGRDDHGRD